MFHLGFLTSEEALVDARHAAMKADAVDVSDVELTRGARRFYCKAPGRILIEVGHQPEV